MARAALIVLSMVLVGAITFGTGGSPVVLLTTVGLALGVVALRGRPTVGLADVSWEARPEAPSPLTASAVKPRDDPGEVDPWSLIGALTPFEARRWLVSPWFAAAVGFCALQVLLFTVVFDVNGTTWRELCASVVVMAHPAVGMFVVGAHAAVTRDRRAGVDEITAACPMDPHLRSAAVLCSAWVPIVVLGLFVAGLVAGYRFRAMPPHGPIDGVSLGQLAAAVALASGGVALGVALGRWARWTVVPIVVVAGLVFPILWLGNIGEPHWSPARQLSTWPRFPPHDLLFTAPRVWWHVLWLLALGAVVALVGLARDGLRRVAVPLGAAVVVAAVAGVVQTRPISRETAAHLASLVAEPARHQECATADRVTVCTYADYDELRADVLAAVAPVVAAAPEEAAGQLTFGQRFDGEVERLGPEVRAALGDRGIGEAVGVPLGFSNGENAHHAARLQAGLERVGIPVRIGVGHVPEVIAGEARGVVALWLAGRGLDRRDADRLASVQLDEHDGRPTAFDEGNPWPEVCDVGPPPVVWSAEDLAAARSLNALPEEDVRRVVHLGWERFTDPATSTDELLAALDLPSVGPISEFRTVPVTCTW